MFFPATVPGTAALNLVSMQETKRTLSPGYILKEYRIEKAIGGGGFSLVYLAYHIATKAKVVIKEYFPEDQCYRLPGGRVLPQSEEKLQSYSMGIKRFFNEASAVAKVNHPNIVHVSNIFRSNNTVYMVMDYEQGTDLRWYIKKRNGLLSEKFLRTVFPQLLLGLREMHHQELLHLDIKPANILLCAGGRPILLDFGAVQHYVIGSTSSWAQTLTLGFAPIEQHQKRNLGPWTDMYAIGATIYSCMSGQPPPAATERAKKDRLVPAAKAYGRRYSKELLQAVDWALKMDYRERPQNVDALLQACFSQDILPPSEPEEEPRRRGLRLPWNKERSQ